MKTSVFLFLSCLFFGGCACPSGEPAFVAGTAAAPPAAAVAVLSSLESVLADEVVSRLIDDPMANEAFSSWKDRHGGKRPGLELGTFANRSDDRRAASDLDRLKTSLEKRLLESGKFDVFSDLGARPGEAPVASSGAEFVLFVNFSVLRDGGTETRRHDFRILEKSSARLVWTDSFETRHQQ